VYDSKNEPHEFIADSRDEAIAKAKLYFGCEQDQLDVGDLEGVYGLGGREVIVAAMKGRSPSPGGGGGGRDRGERDRGDRGRDRGDRGGRGGRDRERGGRGRDRDRDRDRPRQTAPAAEPFREDAPTEPSKGSPRGKLGELGEYLLGIVERLGQGPFEISESEEGGVHVFELKGQAAQALAGGDGRAVDALQLLINQSAVRRDEDAKRVVIDVEGNADAREEFLERLAQRVVRRARESGRSVALDPMSPRDRRIIHITIREQDGMATMSTGEGRYRQVVVVPEGADEYEEAVRQSEGAESH
jgi:predicted RNA-binding protein Jag